MIPVTSFAGKKVAVFGLGGSGLVSASALLAGGADVVGWDDNAETVAKATSRRHSDRRSAPHRLVDRSPRWCWRPAFRSPIPRRIGRSGCARAAAVEVIGDIELYCRERRPHAPNAPFVAITGTNGKSTTTALIAHLLADGRATTPSSAATSAPRSFRSSRPRTGRVHVIECSSYQIDLAPSLDPSVGILINVTEDHLDRHGTMAHYAAVKERLVAGVPEGGTAIVGVDDNWCAAAADRIDRAGKRGGAGLGAPPAAGRALRRGRADHAGRGRHRTVAIAHLGGIGSLRGTHNAQNAACAAGAALALGLSAPADPAGPAVVSRARAPHGAGRPPGQGAVRQRFQGHQCGFRRHRRWPASATSSGLPAASRRPAASPRWRAFSRASARPI